MKRSASGGKKKIGGGKKRSSGARKSFVRAVVEAPTPGG
jgi:hypothetical protein